MKIKDLYKRGGGREERREERREKRRERGERIVLFSLSILLFLILFLLNLFYGSVSIPFRDIFHILLHPGAESGTYSFIIWGSRMPAAITAGLTGAALTVTGLLLQTSFRNPLAGPSILGVTSGAGLGVALVMLLFGGSITIGEYSTGGTMAILLGALAGSVAVMGLLLLFSTWLKSGLMLLIAGIMTGYLTSSVVTLLNYLTSAEGVRSYALWGMGSFNSVSTDQLPLYGITIAVGLGLALLLMKPLNILLLGDNYARSLGINMISIRNILLLTTGLLTAVVTAFCGPIGFIGLAVPHIVSMIFRTADHRVLIPGAIIIGAAIALLCNLLCSLPSDTILPLNAVTPLIGVPVILYVILRKR
ncbi:MAG: iron ABC transporter permease [Muribaculaceae bacterium]|nr:iron ABC transporter permease [Muribaculaceae bacterium]